MTQSEKISKVTVCRGCKGRKFKRWLNLGKQPLANNLVKRQHDGLESYFFPEDYFPLNYMYCTTCELVQTTHVIEPDLLFKDYVYYSSTSEVFRKHFVVLAEKEFNFDRVQEGDLVVDIGSNDGILLKPFRDKGAIVVGVEPVEKIAAQATANGIKTLVSYFDISTAIGIEQNYGKAKLITMTNVFAHVPDLDSIIKGVKHLLVEDGRFMVEVAYLPEMIKKGTFDLLYHEHVCSWHLYPMQVFFARNGMYIDEVEFVQAHGGSVRVYAKIGRSESLIHKASDYGLVKTKLFGAFPDKVAHNKENILILLKKLKKQGKHIIGYGAPAKMSTMTNYFDITSSTIDYIIEEAAVKIGLYSPGKHIKITYPPSDFSLLSVDYIFIFAWNFAESIMLKCRKQGYKGKFIIPFPNVKVI